MNGRILLIVCLALCGLVHGYTLRDMLRERALRRLREFDASQQRQRYSDLETRALKQLREYHLRKMFDEEKVPACVDKHPDCAGFVAENGGQEYCNDPEDYIQSFVKEWCRKTCNVDNCADQIGGNVKPPHPGAPICINQIQDACLYLKDRCYEYYVKKYCTKMCRSECQK
ncbi:hypothetical protein ACROYT_G034296 [Oculina patagonica]